METWRIVEIVLVSLVAGALLPLVLQATTTLRAIRARVEKSADRLDVALEEVTGAVGQVNRIVQGVDERRVAGIVESLEGLSTTLDQLRQRAQFAGQLGAAVAPAIAAAIRALRTPVEDGVQTGKVVPAPGAGTAPLPIHPNQERKVAS